MTRVHSNRPASVQRATTPSPLTPSVPVAAPSPAPATDGYQRVSTSSPPAAGPAQGSTSATPMQLLGAQLGGGAAALNADLDTVANRLSVAVVALPDLGEQGLQHALGVSAARIRDSYASGRVTIEEARDAAHQLSEMVDALIAIEQGKVKVDVTPGPAVSGTSSYDVTTTTGDVLRVMVRQEGGKDGQARLKLQNIADDGAPVRSSQRMMIRFDLEGSELDAAPLKAGWDVEFGSEKPPPGVELLDKRIHGIMLDETGQPLINRGGRSIADHHFHDGIPDALNDREAFKTFTREFLDKLLPPQAGPTQ